MANDVYYEASCLMKIVYSNLHPEAPGATHISSQRYKGYGYSAQEAQEDAELECYKSTAYVWDCDAINCEIKELPLEVGGVFEIKPQSESEDKALSTHVTWCMTHWGTTGSQRGMDIFVGRGEDDILRNLGLLRHVMLKYQSHNPKAQKIIRKASEEDLKNCICRQVPNMEKKLSKNLKWVAYHEKRLKELRGARKEKNAAKVRVIYWAEQSHRKDSTRLWALGSRNSFIFSQIDSYK